MTRDEIIRMARECGAEFRADTIIVNGKDADDFMVAFAAAAYAAGQAEEREACAVMVDMLQGCGTYADSQARRCAAAIRNRK